MWENLPGILPFMIPILGIFLGFAVVVGIFVVQPVLKAVDRWVEVQERIAAGSPDDRIALLSDRFDRLEARVQELSDARDFDRALGRGTPSPPSPEGESP